jgi:hypothetical protein
MQLSVHFSLQRLIYSETALRRGIDNTPPVDLLENLSALAHGLEQVQRLLGHPIEISSGYRCAALNAAVGGAPASAHVQGRAADFVCPPFGTPAQIARAIRDSEIAFDTVILEFGEWVHLAFAPRPRRRVLTIHDAKHGYLEGLREPGGRSIA